MVLIDLSICGGVHGTFLAEFGVVLIRSSTELSFYYGYLQYWMDVSGNLKYNSIVLDRDLIKRPSSIAAWCQ